MKVITIVIPTYNEEENIDLIYKRVSNVFQTELDDYGYQIMFIDNCSKDRSRKKIKALAEKDEHVQYIFNVRNFGFSKSTFYGLTQAEGDAAVLLYADMQDPPETIVRFVWEWEQGNRVVAGIKNASKENPFLYFVRQSFYRLMNRIAEIQHIEQFTGFGLYDREVIKIFRELKDPLPYLRGMVAELAPECKKVYYEQEKRAYGKSSFHFKNLYDVAMLGITSYSRSLMRIAVLTGFLIAACSLFLAVVTFFLKIFRIIDYPIGIAASIFGIFFLGSVQLLFIGVLGEYISNINIRSMGRPLVIEEERYNLERKMDNNDME